MSDYSPEILKSFSPKHEFLVGIDSDGCVFDTMELKHKECFIPVIIKHWNLQAISKYAREAAEFVNLYSKWRGVNRFPALIKVMDLLRKRPEVQRLQIDIPALEPLQQFIDSGVPQGNPALEESVKKSGDEILKRVLEWSKAVNKAIADMVAGIPPFPFVKESLDNLNGRADIIVVSQTPSEALAREWEETGLAKYPAVIAGQEMGSKSEHLAIASQGRYKSDHILMIGDAPGDLKAGRANNALFFPINPGHEEASWERLHREGIDRFFSGRFAGDYAKSLLDEFEKFLPEIPPWKK